MYLSQSSFTTWFYNFFSGWSKKIIQALEAVCFFETIFLLVSNKTRVTNLSYDEWKIPSTHLVWLWKIHAFFIDIFFSNTTHELFSHLKCVFAFFSDKSWIYTTIKFYMSWVFARKNVEIIRRQKIGIIYGMFCSLKCKRPKRIALAGLRPFLWHLINSNFANLSEFIIKCHLRNERSVDVFDFQWQIRRVFVTHGAAIMRYDENWSTVRNRVYSLMQLIKRCNENENHV